MACHRQLILFNIVIIVIINITIIIIIMITFIIIIMPSTSKNLEAHIAFGLLSIIIIITCYYYCT